MGADHVQTITKAVSGAEIRAVADIDPKRAEAAAARVPGAKAFASAELLIESPDVDAVIIASSDATHAQYVTACISARKPVLCEKPLAPTLAVGFMRRFDPGYVELRSRIAAGEIGTPMLAHCSHRNVDVPAGWTSETTVVSAASHEIDVMPWVFGRDIIRVTWLSPRQTPPAPLRSSSSDYGTRGRRSCLRRNLYEIRIRLRNPMRSCRHSRDDRVGANRTSCHALAFEG